MRWEPSSDIDQTMTGSSALKIYRARAGGGGWFAVVMVVVYPLMILQDSAWFFSMGGLISMGIATLIAAYVAFFGFRMWVYLYDTHLALHPRLAKLIQDRLGVCLYRPTVIFYRQIQALRRSRGLGAFNSLAILHTRGKPPQLRGHGIAYQGVENYDDLEAELLRRVPPTCKLYGIDFLGRTRPFM